MRICRTQEMGGHVDQYTCCKSLYVSYNSGENRPCPTCQGHKREEWILLSVTYFHVVFTVPQELNQLFMHHPKELYNILFKSSWATLKQFGTNKNHLGVEPVMIGFLHAWGQNLSLHPHLHCIVPGGGVSKAGHWKMAKNKGKYLFNV
jgi:hypothetical protein